MAANPPAESMVVVVLVQRGKHFVYHAVYGYEELRSVNMNYTWFMPNEWELMKERLAQKGVKLSAKARNVRRLADPEHVEFWRKFKV